MTNLYKSMRKKYMTAFLGITIISSFVSGCGEPDIQSMRPTVSKLAAEVLLVDTPSNWQANDLINAASAAGVDTFVKNVKAQDINTVLNTVAKAGQAGMCLVVYNGSIPQSTMTSIQSGTNVKFELVSDGMNPLQGANVQNIHVDPMWTGFMIGYSAGSLAESMGQYNIGWLTTGSTSIPRKVIEATLGGFYQVNTQANMIPVTISGGGSGSGITLPHILIADHLLDNTELQAVSQSGSVVFSLVKVTSGPEYAAWPAFVDEHAVLQDFSMFANATWKPGDRPIVQSQSILTNALVLPQNISQSIQTEESAAVGNPGLAQSAYASIPNSLKSALGPIVALGS